MFSIKGRQQTSSLTLVRKVRAWRQSRRGVASVLAMMFVVMFGSLSIAMAVASQGNLRTADTHLHVVRAMGAAETGLQLAMKRLDEATARFVIEKGTVNAGLGNRLWTGSTNGADGRITILAAANGRSDGVPVRGIADAVLAAHLTDANIITAPGFPTQAAMFTPSGSTDFAVYSNSGWVRSALIGIDNDVSVRGNTASAYQVTYAPLANGTDVRIIVTGYSSMSSAGSAYHYSATSGSTASRSVTRIVQQDVRIAKRPKHALLSPSRIMVGKNVIVNGNLGARFNDVTKANGDPIQTKGDFDGLDASLDAKIARFRQACATYDVDGDNRLRIGHSIESQGLPGTAELSSKSWPANAFADATKDGYVDEFDLFINHYDTNRDGDVVLSSTLTSGTPAAGRAAEFSADNDLAFLIDNSNPDRNRNGVSGYVNPADISVIAPASAMLDANDRTLGWRDGVINYKDQYAKVKGRLTFRTTSSAWASARGGSYKSKLQGPISPPNGKNPLQFGATTDELPDINESSFTGSQTPLQAAADGASFNQQVATALGVSTGALATYTEAKTDSTQKRFWRADLDDALVFSRTGRHIWEKMPFNSPSYSDFYYRPRYENMTFRNVQIPAGNNGLFINCKFIGVTYVRSTTANTHTNWSLYGQMIWSSTLNKPIPNPQALDKSDFLRYTTGNVVDGPANYTSFPDPPVIGGSVKTGAARDTKLYSNNIRFHDCTFVGSLVSDTPQAYTNLRNKLQFTGATRFMTTDPNSSNAADNPDSADLVEIEKSSLMAPNYSVDVGSYNAPTDTFSGGPPGQNVQLKGTIVAGVMDVRGSARIDGAMFMTFAPTAGQGPMLQNGQAVGNPANFNTTLGYFGTDDGDGEAVDPNTLPTFNGQKIVGWDTDSDGIADVSADQPRPTGSAPVPFYGYGRVEVNWNPDLPMPDGIMLQLSTVPLNTTYREGAH
jgi:hypothetical protein